MMGGIGYLVKLIHVRFIPISALRERRAEVCRIVQIPINNILVGGA